MSRRAGLVALLAADVISALGNWITVIALPWLVLETTGSPVRMGLVAVAELLPYLASGVFATPLADRFGLRRTSILTDLGSALAMAVVATVPGYPALLVLAGVAGGLRGVGDRAKHVLLGPMATRAGMPLLRMTSLYETLTRGTQLLGAPAGGLLIWWLGTGTAIWVDAVSFLACAVLVAVWVRPETPPAAAESGYLAALRGGLAALGRDRVLLAMTAAVLIVNVVSQASTAVFVPLWVSRVLGSPAALGLVLAAFGSGAVLGGAVFTVLADRVPRHPAFTVAVVVSAAPRMFAFGGSSVALLLAVTFVSGAAVAAVNPIFGALLYERVPTELQTRVFGLVTAGTYAGLPLGAALAGAAVALWGLRSATLFGGLAVAAASLLAVRLLGSAIRADRPIGTAATRPGAAAPG